MRKKVILFLLTGTCLFASPAMSVEANSLDDIVSEDDSYIEENEDDHTEESSSSSSSDDYTEGYMNDIRKATSIGAASPGASKVNKGISKITSLIVQVLSYFITACLAVRVVIDLCYICIPFTRTILANGYMGQPQQGGMGGMQGGMGGMGGMGSPMGGMGMGGMGMNRMGMGGMGMRGGMGMGGMGMGGMGMGGMQGGMQGANPAMGKIQWVSQPALNAAASEQTGMNALKLYAKDMTVVLVLTPIFLTLAVTGVLTKLGFLLGEVVANAVGNVGNML